ncbi:MAG: Ppx/GppA family phosphatase [Alphaproteobacteria bacterium]|nr:Ppx/GppA family phosphatase [Alphaproteobacteria bacterium]
MNSIEADLRPAPARAPAKRRAPTYAALDLGTNNCRLLVATPAPGGFRVVDAFSRIVRLGEGMGTSGVLSEAAMARTIDALKVCAAKIRRQGVTRARTVATEACRRAANCQDFVERARAATGLTLEIISSGEEARLSLTGCAPLLEASRPWALVFDIGGGSTELSWARVRDGRPEVAGCVSLPLGVVTLGERFPHGAAGADAYPDMVAEVDAMLAPFDAEHGLSAVMREGGVQMLGSSGTVTTLAGVHLDLPRYDRNRVDGYRLAFAAVEDVTRRIAAMPVAEREKHPCIGRERADLVLAGCAILEAICRRWPVGTVRVADRGVREGILLALMAEAGRA